MAKNKLSEGVVGKELIRYLSNYGGSDKIPVDANCLKLDFDSNQVQYRITFDDESVSDWLITFESSISDTIVSAECFNEVI